MTIEQLKQSGWAVDAAPPPLRGEKNWEGKWFSIVPGAATFDPRLKNADKVCLMAIACHAGPERLFRLPQTTLARKLGWSRQSVNRTIQKLIRCGFLEFVRRTRRKDGSWGANVYRIVGYDKEKKTEPVG